MKIFKEAFLALKNIFLSNSLTFPPLFSIDYLECWIFLFVIYELLKRLSCLMLIIRKPFKQDHVLAIVRHLLKQHVYRITSHQHNQHTLSLCRLVFVEVRQQFWAIVENIFHRISAFPLLFLLHDQDNETCRFLQIYTNFSVIKTPLFQRLKD